MLIKFRKIKLLPLSLFKAVCYEVKLGTMPLLTLWFPHPIKPLISVDDGGHSKIFTLGISRFYAFSRGSLGIDML